MISGHTGSATIAALIRPFFDSLIDYLANSVELAIYFPVGKTQNLQPQLLHRLITLLIVFLSRLLIMLRAVNFDYQFRRSTVKISNIRLDNALFVDFYGICPQK